MGRDFKHELSWSPSRARTFNGCRRSYYYTYYLMWNGWSWEAPDDRKTVYRLKKATRMPFVAGDVVHRALHRFFKGRLEWKREFSQQDTADWARGQLRRAYKESREGKWRESLSRYTLLAEHLYDEPNIQESTGAAATYGKGFIERIDRSIATFFQLPELESVRQAPPSSYLAIDEQDFERNCFYWNDLKIHAGPDFAYRREDGTVVIYDWKTGSPREADALQLQVYALYARERWEIPLDQIELVAAYLADGLLKSIPITEEVLQSTVSTMESSIAEMTELHFDAGVEDGDTDDFPMIPGDSVEAETCTTCNFRQLCGRP